MVSAASPEGGGECLGELFVSPGPVTKSGARCPIWAGAAPGGSALAMLAAVGLQPGEVTSRAQRHGSAWGGDTQSEMDGTICPRAPLINLW